MSTDATLKTLAGIVGAENCIGAGEAEKHSIAGTAAAVGAVYPASVEEVQEVVRACNTDGLSVIPTGAHTKADRCATPDRYDVALVTTHLRRVTDYQKENLVFAAEAGLQGLETRQILAANNHLLPLDPPRFDTSTLGGIVATRASGPARFANGTPRDCVIGVSVVNADGDIVKAGGKVVKNVAGYDMCKLYTGSLGTLGVIVETVFKLSPALECSVAAVAAMSSFDRADHLTAAIMGSSLQPRCIEVFNRAAAFEINADTSASAPYYLLTAFDGTRQQVEFQLDAFEKLAEDNGAEEVSQTDFEWNGEMHRALADVEVTRAGGSLFIFRALSSDVPVLAQYTEGLLQDRGFVPRVIASAGNGIVRAACEECPQEAHAALTQTLSERTGRGRGISLQAFSSQGAPASETWIGEIGGLDVMRTIKQQLDPSGVFASGRFVGGI